MAKGDLAQLDNLQRALDACRDIFEVKDVRDKAEALRKYAQAAGLGLEHQNACATAKLKAERKAGAILVKTVTHEGGRPQKHSHDGSVLKDVGINFNQSHRWQRMAGIPERDFQKYVRETKAGLILAKTLAGKGRPPQKMSHDVTFLSDAGIERMQSSRWQRMAGIPERDFQKYLAETKKAETWLRQPTTN